MRHLLYIISFLCGFVIMAYEILGVRMLTPYYGSSVYVWGATISVFMAGLSVGYAFGGRVAISHANGKSMALLLSSPALLILTFPLYAYGFANMIYSLGLDSRTGALLLSMLLFFIPSLFVASVLPVIIEILAENQVKAGTAAGKVYSASTCGSIAGTLFTSFYLIRWMGVAKAIVLTGFLLALNVVLCLVSRQKINRADFSAN